MLISNSMGFRTFFFSLCFHSSCLFIVSWEIPRIVSRFQWSSEMEPQRIFSFETIYCSIYTVDYVRSRPGMNTARKSPTSPSDSGFFFFLIWNELICSQHSPRRILSSTIAVDFLFSKITRVAFKHSQTQIHTYKRVHRAYPKHFLFHFILKLSIQLKCQWIEMDAKRFFGAFDVECCISFNASMFKKR